MSSGEEVVKIGGYRDNGLEGDLPARYDRLGRYFYLYGRGGRVSRNTPEHA